MNVSHLLGRDEYSFGKGDSFSCDWIKEMLRKSVFFMRGNDDKLDLIEVLKPFLLSQNLSLEFMQQFIWRIMLNPQKRVGDINKKDWFDFLDDVGVEQSEILAD